MLIGHAAARAVFEAAWSAGRMPHAWLLSGPEGVGKRAFAQAAARMVLAGAATMEVDDDAPAARLMAAGSHPDLRLLERGLTARGDRLAAVIDIEQLRACEAVLRLAPAMAVWRVVIVDPAEAMHRPTANALLKSLEEPPPRTLFLLVCHAPGRLLPTIRSRCRRLRLAPLDAADSRAVLRRALGEDEDLEPLLALAQGAPGRALRFAGVRAAELVAELEALAAEPPPRARARALALARSLSGRAAQPRYEAFLDLAPRHLALLARQRRGPALAATLALWEEARDLASEGAALDPAQVVIELARLLASAGSPPP